MGKDGRGLCWGDWVGTDLALCADHKLRHSLGDTVPPLESERNTGEEVGSLPAAERSDDGKEPASKAQQRCQSGAKQ